MSNDRVGQQFGLYRLMRKLGEEGFNETYLGEHIHSGTYAAIKMPRADLEKETEFLLKEARMLSRLEHPHIVRIFEFGEQDGIVYLALEYAPKGSLYALLHPKREELLLETVVRYVKQIASALQYVHDNGIIHRDVNPTNILLKSDDSLLLSNFTIAIPASAEKNETEAVGTPVYMPPEQWDGQPVPATDQYALAIMSYQLLTGRTPFFGRLEQVMRQHFTVQPEPPGVYNPAVSPALDAVILRALAKQPEARFLSIADFADALELAVLQSLEPPPAAQPPSGWEPRPPAPPPRWELEHPPQATYSAPRWEPSLAMPPPRGVVRAPAAGRLPGFLVIVFMVALLIAGGTYFVVRGSGNSSLVLISQVILFTAAICLVPTLVALLIRRRR